MNFDKMNIVYLSSFLMSFSYGVLLTLPLFFSSYLGMPIEFSGGVISMGIFGVFPAILLLPKFYSYFTNSRLISTGAFIYSVGIVLILKGNVFFYYVAGMLFGVGWGVVYTLGPIIVSQLSTDFNRVNNFSYISAFNMLGAGLSPVLVHYLISQNFSIYNVYLITFFISIVASFSFLLCKPGLDVKNQSATVIKYSPTNIASTEIIPMIMVFLGACIFSSMMNFQSLIAASKDLNFSYFYISYTLAVIVCRFTLTTIVNKINNNLMIFSLLSIMSLSLFFMKFVNSNYFYIIPSALLGLSYGLVYPLIQNASVRNSNTEGERKRNLTLFSLFYFIGVYAFPYIFSLIVSRYGFDISMNVLIFIGCIEIIFSVLLFKTFSKSNKE